MSEGLAQGPYLAAGVGFEPANLRTQGTELTKEPPRPVNIFLKLFWFPAELTTAAYFLLVGLGLTYAFV